MEVEAPGRCQERCPRQPDVRCRRRLRLPPQLWGAEERRPSRDLLRVNLIGLCLRARRKPMVAEESRQRRCQQKEI
jgi:hypothetical protein